MKQKLDYGQSQQKEEGYFSNFIHVVGKDIVKFHAIYWPAFLLGLNLPLPQKIIIHNHWILQGVTISFLPLNFFKEKNVKKLR